MSVIQVQKGGGLLGGIGKVLGLAGTFVPGMQWATALGAGMSGIDSIIRGDAGAVSSLGPDFWKKLFPQASGNLTEPWMASYQQVRDPQVRDPSIGDWTNPAAQSSGPDLGAWEEAYKRLRTS
jgi:hypothetical protein